MAAVKPGFSHKRKQSSENDIPRKHKHRQNHPKLSPIFKTV